MSLKAWAESPCLPVPVIHGGSVVQYRITRGSRGHLPRKHWGHLLGRAGGQEVL